MCRIGGLLMIPRRQSIVEAKMKYHSLYSLWLTTTSILVFVEHCMVGSLTGAVTSQRVTEVCEGRLKLVGNQL